MIARLTDRALDKLLGKVTAQACLCQRRCYLRWCSASSFCSSGTKLGWLECVRCDCSETAYTGCVC